MNRTPFAILSVAALSTVLASCSQMQPPTTQAPQGRVVYGVTTDNRLVKFGSDNPSTSLTSMSIGGLANGEQILGIDFEPGTNARAGGTLTAVSSANRLYAINTATGAATVVGSAAFTPSVNGANFGVDFNPVPNRVRLHSDAGQNLRLNQESGAVAAIDTALTYAAGDAGAGSTPALVGTAYTNSVSGATTTTLYAIDSNRDTLVRLDSPNNGVATTIGALGVNTTANVGFDIAADNSLALVSLTPSGANASTLYTLAIGGGAITSGTVTAKGTLGVTLRGLAIAP